MTPDDGRAFWRSTPLGAFDIAFRQQSVQENQMGLTWLTGSHDPIVLLYDTEAHITPGKVLVDGSRGVFALLTGQWVAGQSPSALRAEWAAIAERCVMPVNFPYVDPVGEAFGRACEGLWAPGAPDVFTSDAAREEVRAWIERLIAPEVVMPADLTGPRVVVDYFAAHGRDFMDCLLKESVSGIARYLVEDPLHDPRAVTPAEIDDAHATGLSVHFFFEMSPTTPAYFTFARGQHDARSALAHLRGLGAPKGIVVYFAIDAPASVIPVVVLDEYFNGIEDVLTDDGDGLIVPGLYGFEAHVEYARTRFPNVGKHLAQTYGTKRGPLDLWQNEQLDLCGVAVDWDECSVEGWKGEDMASEQQIREWAKEEARAVLSQEYGPALEAELAQRLADNSAGDVGAAVAASIKAVGEKLTKQ